MVLVSKELRCLVLLPPDRTGSVAEVAVVMEGKPRGSPVVRVRFEPGRIERECLAGAYEQVVPIRRRVVVPIETRSAVARAPMLQRVGGVGK
jgi:hypothetical protein